MRQERLDALAQRIRLLKRRLRALVAAYDARAPFTRAGQRDSHQRTIAARRSAGSVAAALADDSFIKLLYDTLRRWGIGLRSSRLLPLPEFARAIRRCGRQISALERFAIDDVTLDVARVAGDIMLVITNLRIVDNKATLVPCTKALHHLLPDLVVPIDREYTQTFFGWHNPEFQSRQSECFQQAFAAFADIARATNPQQYVRANGWHTSKTKVIDNAVVSCVLADAKRPRSRTRRAAREDKRTPTDPDMTAGAFAAELTRRLRKATRSGQASIQVRAGDLHTAVGGYPGRSHRMPACCREMKKAMVKGDRVVGGPPAGQGASLTIEYRLPRQE